jgi:DNA-binding IclR family transcriptional regulator
MSRIGAARDAQQARAHKQDVRSKWQPECANSNHKFTGGSEAITIEAPGNKLQPISHQVQAARGNCRLRLWETRMSQETTDPKTVRIVRVRVRGSKYSGAKDRQFVTALARGLEILQCFSPSKPELGTAEIAKMIDLPQPTVWRLSYTMMKRGFLVYSPQQKKLRLGVPVLGLGYAVAASQPIGELARPYMQAIADSCQGAVSLGARDGLNMIYLQRSQGPSIIFTDFRVGSRVPMGSSSTGWAYLAGLEAEAREELLKEIRSANGARWAQTEQRFRAALKRYPDEGYIVNKGSLHPQINGVAVPIHFQDGGELLSVSAGGISSLFTDKKLQSIGRSLVELASSLAIVRHEQPTMHAPT